MRTRVKADRKQKPRVSVGTSLEMGCRRLVPVAQRPCLGIISCQKVQLHIRVTLKRKPREATGAGMETGQGEEKPSVWKRLSSFSTAPPGKGESGLRERPELRRAGWEGAAEREGPGEQR